MNQLFQSLSKVASRFVQCAFDRNTFLSIIAILFLTASCSTDTSEDIPAVVVSPTVISYSYSADESSMMNLVNQYREEQGLEVLNTVNLISVQSEEHNQYMIEHNTVSHAFFTERAQIIMNALNATNVNENLAYNYSSPQGALAAWKNSEEHRENILGDFTDIGIAISRDPQTGKPYYTMIFAKR